MSKVTSAVGERIRYLRLSKELSQEKLALEAGINPAFLGHLERGLKSPTVDTLAKIAAALNVTLSELVAIEEISQNNSATEKITLLLNGLSSDEADCIAHIVAEIIKLKQNT